MVSNVVLVVTGHSHKQNINVRAAMVHAIGDLVQSVGILVAALVIFFKVSCRPLYLRIYLFTVKRIKRHADAANTAADADANADAADYGFYRRYHKIV